MNLLIGLSGEFVSRDLSQLSCLGLSVKNGDAAEIRERATLRPETMIDSLKKILQDSSLGTEDSGLLYLDTCHRVEIYGYGLEPQKIYKTWLKERHVEWDFERVKKGIEAFRHLVRVSSSLESEVLGETQITGQVKEAADRSRSWGLLKGPLDRCLQQALRSAKKIRKSTRLSEGTVSVAHVAVDGLSDVFDSFDGKNALVIGAGSMATQALERLLAIGVENITWVNRSRERLEGLSPRPQISVADFHQRAELVWAHSITVVATSSSEFILRTDDIKSSSHSRKSPEPRVILDLGLPRNVDESIHGYHGFYVRNVDEFKDRAAQNSEQRRTQIGLAEEILRGEVNSFLKLWNVWEKGPLIAEIFKGIERLRDTELGEVSVDKKVEIEYIVRSIYAKLMHRLVEEMEGLDEPLATQIMETMVRAWRHPEQWLQRNQQASQRRLKQSQK